MRFLRSPVFQVSLVVVAVLILSATYSNDNPARAVSGTLNGFTTRAFTDSNGITVTYYLHVPQGYDPTKKYPLVLVLHGGGEHAQATSSPAKNRALVLDQFYVHVWTSTAIQQKWPSFVVVPQLVGDARWVDVPGHTGSYTLASAPSNGLLAAKEIVDDLQRQYTAIDPSRRYVTGISMGGYGTWEAIERWPTYFTAAIPMAGAGDPSKAAEIAHLPIWDFHGAKDTVAPVSGSRDMIAALRAAGGDPRYTEYPTMTHGVWQTAYSMPSLFTWLFAQRSP
jgi:predicted peptidase